ncbi:MAG: RNA 2',3'-cyclic phosphodiesterase [Clostridiales bacterium]|nr:RNA 2',3'-cyclic phosphodiesterase [Clostridiales bacterium]
MRAFIGIGLPDSWRHTLNCCAEQVRAVCPEWRDARWVPPENLHVTLAFLGEIAPQTVDPIMTALHSTLSSHQPFTLTLKEPVVPVPHGRRVRMLWATLDDSSGKCEQIARAVGEAAASYGALQETRTFKPHITLARARSPLVYAAPGNGGFDQCITPCLTSDAAMSVALVTLYSSTLTPQGARYAILGNAPLAGR